MSRGMMYVMVIRSWGTAFVPAGQAPVFGSGKTMWVRWLALSVFLPSQQLGKSCTRMTRLPLGQMTYLSESRSVKPLQVQLARALAGPRLVGFASPVMAFRNFGIATTWLVGLPRYSMVTLTGWTMPPMFPATSRFGPSTPGSGAVLGPAPEPPAPPALFSVHGASDPSPGGRGALRPIAIAMRSRVAARLSFSGPRTALSTKFGPPWPCVVTSRWF